MYIIVYIYIYNSLVCTKRSVSAERLIQLIPQDVFLKRL